MAPPVGALLYHRSHEPSGCFLDYCAEDIGRHRARYLDSRQPVTQEAILSFMECSQCKQALKVVDKDGQELILEMATGQRHVCWSLPQDANLIVLDD